MEYSDRRSGQELPTP